MMQLIKTILEQFIKDIDSGNSNINEAEQGEIISLFEKINHKEMSKIESANYIGVSRATFDNYIVKGLIPKGHKRQGFKELSWFKKDLDICLKGMKKQEIPKLT